MIETLLSYLTNHPVQGLLLVVLAISLVYSIIKKLLKLALILGIIFLSSSGLALHFSQQEWAAKGKHLLKQVQSEFDSKVKKHLPLSMDTVSRTVDTLTKRILK